MTGIRGMTHHSIPWAIVSLRVVLSAPACARGTELCVSRNGEWQACAGPLNSDCAAMISRKRSWRPVIVLTRQWSTKDLNDPAAERFLFSLLEPANTCQRADTPGLSSKPYAGRSLPTLYEEATTQTIIGRVTRNHIT